MKVIDAVLSLYLSARSRARRVTRIEALRRIVHVRDGASLPALAM